jgi:transcriptional regulator with XRE-family HTH domain
VDAVTEATIIHVRIYSNLRAAMDLRCVTNAQLAEAVGVSPAQVNRWCHGTGRLPDIAEAVLIANYLGVKDVRTLWQIVQRH